MDETFSAASLFIVFLNEPKKVQYILLLVEHNYVRDRKSEVQLYDWRRQLGRRGGIGSPRPPSQSCQI
jgi:hypothetical protein